MGCAKGLSTQSLNNRVIPVRSPLVFSRTNASGDRSFLGLVDCMRNSFTLRVARVPSCSSQNYTVRNQRVRLPRNWPSTAHFLYLSPPLGSPGSTTILTAEKIPTYYHTLFNQSTKSDKFYQTPIYLA